jgi:hypothetical protein
MERISMIFILQKGEPSGSSNNAGQNRSSRVAATGHESGANVTETRSDHSADTDLTATSGSSAAQGGLL